MDQGKTAGNLSVSTENTYFRIPYYGDISVVIQSISACQLHLGEETRADNN